MRSYNSIDLDRDDFNFDFDNECKEAEWPEFLDARWIKKPIVVMTVLIGILVTALVTNQAPIDSDFALYKNTGFRECRLL
ncbi:hypothetical protein BJX70DRAFT_396129 [Aspergillus crustosus]